MAEVIGFFAHKGGIHQTNIPKVQVNVPDPLITFPFTNWNIGGYYDPLTSRFTPPAGIYASSQSYNVADPVSGGKYYALLRRNGEPNTDANQNAFVICNPNRMYGSQDTVGTQVSGQFYANGTDYFEAVFQHSNGANSCWIGGKPFESFWCVNRIGDYNPPGNPTPPGSSLVEGTTGTPTPVSDPGSYLYIDRSWSIDAGRIVEKIGLFTTRADTYTLRIVKRNSAGNYDVVLSQDVTHTGSGWEDFSLPSAWTEPNDGKLHYLGAVTTATEAQPMFDFKPRTYAGPTATGTNISMTEQAQQSTAGYYVMGTRVTYTA